MNNMVIGSLAFIGLGGVLASGTVSKLRDHIRGAVTASGAPTSPFQASGPGGNPLTPIPVGGGGDEAYGPSVNGGPISAAGTSDGSTFTLSGVINYWQGGRLQQTVIPGLKGQSFIIQGSDPAAPISIPSPILDQISKGLGMNFSNPLPGGFIQ